MNEKIEEFEILIRYYKTNAKSKDNENKIKVLDIEKINTIITQLKEQNKYENIVEIVARKIERYLNGEDQRFVTFGKVRDIAILLNVTLTEILTDDFLENIINAEAKKNNI